jgi:predicted protein tyrosine phosphatase
VSVIRFVSRAVAQPLPGCKRWAVISISDEEQGPAKLQDGWGPVLRLEFLDIDAEQGEGVLFDKAMAKQILAFADEAFAEGLSLLVHCHAGLSRSGAVAVFLGSVYKLGVYADTIRMHPGYGLYNKHVYRTLLRVMQGYD